MKKAFISILFSFVISLPILSGVCFGNNSSVVEVDAVDTISSLVTRIFVDDQVGTNTKVLSIEEIGFDTSKGYDSSHFESFLRSYLGSMSTYDVSDYTTYPSTAGWSYMRSGSSVETSKYLLCPSGAIQFTMELPEWVTYLKYKAVGLENNAWKWYEVNGGPIELRSDWGIHKSLRSYIYNYGGVQMNVNLDNNDQYKMWGDILIYAKIIDTETGTTTSINIPMSKYYRADEKGFDEFGYDFDYWYTTKSMNAKHTILMLANYTLYAKKSVKTVAYLSGTMNGWVADDSDYLMAPGDNQQYVIHTTLEKDTEFKVVYLTTNWYGYSEVDIDSKVVKNGSISIGSDPDSTGYRIKVNITGLYEIYLKTNVSSNRIWIQQDSTVEATAYATTFLSTITCTSVSTTFTIDEWNHNDDYETTSMEYMFSQLDQGAKDILNAAIGDEGGDKIAQAVARYDRILSKYGYGVGLDHYHDFMERKPSPSSSSKGIPTIFNISTSNNIVPIIIVVSLIFGVSVGGYFLLRKKEEK